MEKKRVRKKEFKFEGAECTVGALTFRQGEELFANGKKAKNTEIATISLQNGEPEAGWTEDEVINNFDDVGFRELMREICLLNKLEWKEPDSGEPQAADSTSSKPAAE